MRVVNLHVCGIVDVTIGGGHDGIDVITPIVCQILPQRMFALQPPEGGQVVSILYVLLLCVLLLCVLLLLRMGAAKEVL